MCYRVLDEYSELYSEESVAKKNRSSLVDNVVSCSHFNAVFYQFQIQY